MKEYIQELKQLQKEMFQDKIQCNECCASCSDCKRYNAISNILEMLEKGE